jgi:hypothetical protein
MSHSEIRHPLNFEAKNYHFAEQRFERRIDARNQVRR